MSDKQFNDQIVEVMFTLSRKLKDEMTFDSKTSQLTILQLQTLIFINKQETVTMSDVAKKFKITLPTATSLSDKLVKSELVERTHSVSDRRVVTLQLTIEGTRILNEAMKQRRVKATKLLSYLSEDEKVSLLKIMKSLLDTIQKNNEK